MTEETFIKNNIEYKKITLTAGDLVCETCRPSYFYSKMFKYYTHNYSLRVSNYQQISKLTTKEHTYTVWTTVFNQENKYNDNSVWQETILIEGGRREIDPLVGALCR